MIAQPLAKRLRLLAKDSANTTMIVLNLFTGIRATKKTREEFRGELKRTIEQVQKLSDSFKKLEEHLIWLEGQVSEANEQEMIHLVESAADASMIFEDSIKESSSFDT